MKSLFDKVLVAVNGSQQSIHAAMYAILLAKETKCSIRAVYVVDTAALKQLTMSKFLFKEESEKYERSLETEGKNYLEMVTKLADSKNVKIETELRKGSPWSELIRSADEFKADFIVLGGREQDNYSGSSGHDSLSATNSDVSGHAKCNVLIVRQRDIEQLFKIS